MTPTPTPRISWRGRGWPGRALTAAAALIAATSLATAAATAGTRQPASPARSALSAAQQPPALAAASLFQPQPVCGAAAPGYASCQAIRDTGLHWGGRAAWAGGPAPAARPRTAPPDTTSATTPLAPYMAADLQSAYRLPSDRQGSGQTIAIVDAFDDPNAESDLAVYRAANSRPACTTANGCFAKVNQDGQQVNYPAVDPTGGWEEEESLDLDMASATCPNCKIILVEANDSSDANLGAAENEAAGLGATVISNSYGGPEVTGVSEFAAAFDHPGIAITVSSGDLGFQFAASDGGPIGLNSFPADLASVTAVGGTSLYRSDTARGWSESGWYSFPDALAAGSGCSVFVPKPSWQHDPLCGDKRTIADVAAVADPDTPVAVYDTYAFDTGWEAFGGTSVAAPLVAGVYALAGNSGSIGPGASWLYAHHDQLFDVTGMPGTTGSADCGGSYLCVSGPGYDGPTGWGTPNGTGAF